MKQLLTAQQVQQALDTLYNAIFANWPDLESVPPAVVGIRTRGEIIAQRLAERLRRERGVELERGVLDITFYRDDLSRRKGAPLVRATEIDFDLDDRVIVLIDDVLHTGRSVRAALDAVTDFGRPKIIRLGVLIDRGGRELPIAADYIGQRLLAADETRVKVRMHESDGVEGVFLIDPAGDQDERADS